MISIHFVVSVLVNILFCLHYLLTHSASLLSIYSNSSSVLATACSVESLTYK